MIEIPDHLLGTVEDMRQHATEAILIAVDAPPKCGIFKALSRASDLFYGPPCYAEYWMAQNYVPLPADDMEEIELTGDDYAL